MKRVLLILLLLVPAWAQTTPLEMMREALKLTALGTQEAYSEAETLYHKALLSSRDSGDHISQAQALLGLGGLETRRGRLSAAREQYEQALKVSQKSSQELMEAFCRNALGQLSVAEGNFSLALQELELARTLFVKNQKPVQAATVHVTRGLALRRSGKVEEALEEYDLAASTFRQHENWPALVNVLSSRVTLLIELGRPAQALSLSEELEQLETRRRNAEGEFWALTQQGVALANLGRLDESDRHLERALRIDRQDPVPPLSLLVALTRLSLNATHRGQYQKAEVWLKRCLQIAKRTESHDILWSSQKGLSVLYRVTGRHWQALAIAEAGVEQLKNTDNRLAQADAQVTAAQVEEDLGLFESALYRYRKACSYRQQHHQLLASTLNSLGRLFHTLGDFEAARKHHLRALALSEPYPLERSRTLSDLCKVNHAQAKAFRIQAREQEAHRASARGARWMQLALEVANSLEQGQERVAVALDLIAQLSETGQYQEALDRSLRLEPEVAQVSAVYGEALALRICSNLTKLDRADEALQRLKSLELKTKMAELQPTIEGWAYQSLGQHERALERFQVAYQTALRHGIVEQVDALVNLTEAARRAGRTEAALGHARLAEGLLEGLPAQTRSRWDREAFWRASSTLRGGIFRYRYRILLEAGRQEEAFEVWERGLARSLLETLSRANISELPLETHRERLRLQAAFRYLSAQVEDAAQPSEDLSRRLREVQAQLKLLPPPARLPETITLERLQSLLGPEVTLIQYALDREACVAFVIDQNSLTVHRLAPRSTLERAASQARSRLILGQPEVALQALSKLILEPIQPRLRHRQLVFVPDGLLHLTPFATLPLDGRPLVERHDVATLPSSSLLPTVRRMAKTLARKPSVVVFADPVFGPGDARFSGPSELSQDGPVALARSHIGAELKRLPATATEAQAVTSLLGGKSTVQLGFDATREAVLMPEAADILHLATHAVASVQDPLRSSLILSLVDSGGQELNGLLTVTDLYQVQLDYQLVVLSACQTSLGRVMAGEGVVGLTRGFLRSGSPRVVASLWKVDDQATARLMTHFYGAMARGLSPAQALAQAQREMRKHEKWASPYYWAAFQLTGDWR